MIRFLADIRKEYGNGAFALVFCPFLLMISLCGFYLLEFLYRLFT